jgi:23S rRNA (cytidine2498-2'-O)-methyltransferase
MSTPAPQFVFMTCRPGAEGALKREVARKQPGWRLAFSRPGFVTFKLGGDGPLDLRAIAETRWTFAHAHGFSLGRLTDGKLGELAGQLWELVENGELSDSIQELADVHVWQHALAAASGAADDEFSPALPYTTPLALEIETAIRVAAPECCPKLRRNAKPPVKKTSAGRRRPCPRDALVLDVLLLSPGEWWIGYHRATTIAERWPGGYFAVPLPAHAVSRAYGKLEEAIRWSGLPLAAGDECVEIGCAPGGASQALLDRGCFVTGIDPANVDPVLREHPRFRHLKKRGADVRRSEFHGVRWLVADMNIAPQATLAEVEPIVTHPGVTIRGLVLTLKLSDWNLAEQIDDFVARVRGWGYRDVRVRQLTTGGQEVCLVALRRKALRRLGKKQERGARPPQARRHSPGKVARPSNDVSNLSEMTIENAPLRVDPPQTLVSGPHF